jgi:periplasmic divalent cation tolerance protein
MFDEPHSKDTKNFDMLNKNDEQKNGEIILVQVSCPPDRADSICLNLLESGLASCINVIPVVKSFYRWRGKLQQDNESLLLIKCSADSYSLLERHILDIHPYELPEIIIVSVSGGLTDYIDWVLDPENKHSE